MCFSRVIKEKGIEDAIKVVKDINDKNNKICFNLDIYGPIDKSYKEQFEEIIKNCPPYIKYKGVVDYKNTVNILKTYFCLLFPTYYVGEGIAGTIIDAFSSGVPVIATDWKYNKEIVEDGYNGYIYKTRENKELIEILEKIYKEPNLILQMKENCLETAKNYTPINNVEKILSKLK